MSLSKFLAISIAVVSIALQAGCNQNSAKVEIERSFAELKTASEELAALLGEVRDKESASKNLEPLKACFEVVAEKSKNLEVAEMAKSRTLTQLKRTVMEYRMEQKKEIKEHITRIQNMSELKEILEPAFRGLPPELIGMPPMGDMSPENAPQAPSF